MGKPRHETTLARFSALRCLSLLKVEYLLPAEVHWQLTWPLKMLYSSGSSIINCCFAQVEPALAEAVLAEQR